MYAGLLLCEVHSQRSATTFVINSERSANALPPIHIMV